MIRKIAWQQLWSKPLTTSLLLLVMALAVALSVLVVSLGSGLQRGLIAATEPFTLLVGSPGSSQQFVLNTVFLQDKPLSNISYQEVTQLRANTKLVKQAIPLAFGDSVKGFRLVGTEPEIFTVRADNTKPEWLRLSSGRPFQTPFEAVIGQDVAKQLGLALGDTFYSTHGTLAKGKEHQEEKFTVVGILADTGGPYNQAVLTPIESIWELHAHGHKPNRVQGQLPKAAQAQAQAQAQEQVQDQDHSHDLSEKGDVTAIMVEPVGFGQAYTLAAQYVKRKDAQLVFPAQVITQLFNLMGRGEKVWQPIGYLLIGLAMTVVLVTAYLATVNRLRDYAILKALGATQKQLYSILIQQTAYVIGLGAVFGWLMGFGAYLGLAYALNTSSAIIMPLAISSASLQLTLLCIVVGLAVSLLPVYAFHRKAKQLHDVMN